MPKYNFHCKPFMFETPLDKNVKYIGGTMPWIDYTPEALAEALEAYEKYLENLKITAIPETWEVASHKDPNKKYKVTRSNDGRWTCECAGYIYRKFCSHIEKLGGKR